MGDAGDEDRVGQEAADRAVMRYEAMAFKWCQDHGIDKAINHIAGQAGPKASQLGQAIHGLVTQAWIEGADAGFQARKALHQTTKAALAELEETFDIVWQANMRAVDLWRAAHPGNELVLPDRAELCGWLLERLDAANLAPTPDKEPAHGE